MNNKTLKYYLRKYPSGTRIQLDADMDDPQPILAGTKGTIIDIDDMGQALMKWDNGRSLSLILGHDSFHVISQEKCINGPTGSGRCWLRKNSGCLWCHIFGVYGGGSGLYDGSDRDPG